MSRTKCFWLEWNGATKTYRRTDTGETFEHPHFAGVGALYDAPWLRTRAADFYPAGCAPKSYPDGLTVCAITSSGSWVIDGPSFDGTTHQPCPWTRTGDPRNPSTFTVHPSIDFPGRGKYPSEFHGWLQSGELYPV